MPAKAGIHDLPSLQQSKSWIPAFSGMAGLTQRGWVNLYVGWYNPMSSERVPARPAPPHTAAPRSWLPRADPDSAPHADAGRFATPRQSS
jgi:hypothetical protein